MPSVKDLMTKDVLTTSSGKTALEAAKLMKEAERGSIIIVEDEDPVGILTERDCLRKIVAEDLLPSEVYVRNIMSKPLIMIDYEASIADAARLMAENGIRRLPVVKDRKLAGIIVASDFAKHLSKKSITDKVLEAMARSYPSPV